MKPIRNLPPAFWFVALCTAWLLPGLLGRLPWKGADIETFTNLLAAREQGEWLFPGVQGRVEPLYLWLAQSFGGVFGHIMPLHDAVRIGNGLLVAVSLWLTALTARRLYGPGAGWPVVFSLMGCMGLLVPAHEINPYTAQLAAMSLFLYGQVRMLEQPLIGGGLSGLGLSAMLMGGAWLPALALLAGLVALPVVFPSWRTSTRVGSSWFAVSIVLAVCGAWLLSVQSHLPVKFAAWWSESRNAFFWSEGSDKFRPFYFLGALSWFAWPAWPVAGWAVYRLKREGWDSVKLWMPLGVFLVCLLVLSVQAHPDDLDSMILLPPLAILTGVGLAELRRGAANALMWFSIMAFSFFGLMFWVYWSALDLHWPAQLFRRLTKLGMESEGFRWIVMSLGLLVTLAWVIGLIWVFRQPRVPQRPVLVWSAGVCFIWALLMALFMGPLDKRLSYVDIAGQLERQTGGRGCVATRNLGLTHRKILAYHSTLDLRPGVSEQCEWLLTYNKSRHEVVPAGNWQLDWKGGLPGQKGDRFWLYRRTRPDA